MTVKLLFVYVERVGSEEVWFAEDTVGGIQETGSRSAVEKHRRD